MRSHNYIKQLDSVEAHYKSLLYLEKNHPEYNIQQAVNQFLYVFSIRRSFAKPKNEIEQQTLICILWIYKCKKAIS